MDSDSTLTQDALSAIDAYWRAANYLSAAQIYLLDNPLLREPLAPEHIKPRLLGHWGTVPGLNLIYAHMNRVIRARDLDAIFIAGPGHGAPGVLANVYLEGTYSEVYPDINRDIDVLRTPKGWTGPKEVDGTAVEGTFHAHQVPLPATRTNAAHREQLQHWLESYRPQELFDADGRLMPELQALAPEGDRRMGANPHANGGVLRRALDLPDFRDYAVEVERPGNERHSATRVLGSFLRDVIATGPGLHRSRGQQEGRGRARVLATGCQHAALDPRSLPAHDPIRERDRGRQAAGAVFPWRGRGDRPLRARPGRVAVGGPRRR